MFLTLPRIQHYSFAHRYLRDKAFGNPVKTVDQLSREKGSEYLKILWLTAGSETKDSDDEFIGPDGIECYPFLIGDKHRGVIVQFPEPLGPTEAFFVAIVVPIEVETGDKCSCQYITLELSADRPDETVLGEWRDTTHINCGLGPPSSRAYFEKTIIARMLGESYDPWKDQQRFYDWVDAANDVLAGRNVLTDDDVELILSLSDADKESEFSNFLIQLRKRPKRPVKNGIFQDEVSDGGRCL